MVPRLFSPVLIVPFVSDNEAEEEDVEGPADESVLSSNDDDHVCIVGSRGASQLGGIF